MTHRIRYLKNALSGNAKQLIDLDPCNATFYETALNRLMAHPGVKFILRQISKI